MELDVTLSGTGKTGKERIRKELADRGRTSMKDEIRMPKKPEAAETGEDKQNAAGIKTEPEAVRVHTEGFAAAAGTPGDMLQTDMPKNGQKDSEYAGGVPREESGTEKAGSQKEEDTPKKEDSPKKEKTCSTENVIREGSEEELRALKAWLFKENIRMETLRKEMEEEKEQLARDRKRFAEESRAKEGSIEQDRKRLEQENRFFDQKMKILQGGFEQLEADRRQFRKEKDKFDACKEVYGEKQDVFKRYEVTEMLFRGVNSFLALKKRYKDLIKMFHPDNVAGDHEMVQLINKEYEELKKAYEVGKQA